MKKLTITLFASIALAATSFAGHEMVSSGKDFKDKTTPETFCFQDHEIQFNVFGAYSVGEGGTHAGPMHDHGWGGGIGVNYFFSRYIGVGAEGYWLAERRNDGAPGVRNSDNDMTTLHNVDGSLIFRLPIDRICLAPYAFIGGGAALAGEQWAVGFVGVGAEYRLIPNKLGLFIDARWNYYGDRHGDDDQNNFTSRAGVRWVF